MLIACWSPKGGSGTTVISCALALVVARSSPTGHALIADLAGDVPAVAGIDQPAGPGLSDWLAAGNEVPADALSRLAVEITPELRLLPWTGAGSGPVPNVQRGEALAAALAAEPAPVVADCGTAPGGAALAVAAAATVSLMVVRPCYLALRRALASPIRPTAVVLVNEPHRVLTRRDIEDVIGLPVRAVVDYDPAIARAVDAGLLARKVPRALQRALERAA